MADPTIKALDIRLLDNVFQMQDGYVLDFSNATFFAFFRDELGIDIDDPKFAVEGTSKAKRLRYFLRTVPAKDAVRTIESLWEYREALRRMSGKDETIPNASEDINGLLRRLDGQNAKPKPPISNTKESSRLERKLSDALCHEFLKLSTLDPHPRGYAFEKFLKKLFDAYGLGGRASFKLYGEQIDGSFELANETYLLEAKWTNKKTDAATLRAFDAKVQDKAAWSRGLFVSQNGFSDEGLHAFGRGKRIVCMDGLDLYEMLSGQHRFSEVLAKKVRRAAETGNPFVRIRDLGLS